MTTLIGSSTNLLVSGSVFSTIGKEIGFFDFTKQGMILAFVGFIYATYGALTITAVTIFGIIKYNQFPNLYGAIGLVLIVVGVTLLNLFGKVK